MNRPISSKSKKRVTHFLNPGPRFARTVAPIRLTVRELIHHKRRAKLRSEWRFAEVEGRLLLIESLVKYGMAV